MEQLLDRRRKTRGTVAPLHATSTDSCPNVPPPSLLSLDSGQALVEFALVLPVLLLVVFGIFTFGIAFSNYLVLEDATNVGARQLAISRGQTTDPCSTASTAVIAAAPTLTKANLGFSYTFNGNAASGTSCTSAAVYLVQNATAKITVTYPCSLVSFRWNYGACTLTAATAELIQ
ncbi:MAG: TadE/TadG family type IV pilus assembly protein [Janthinobacterium lividum]